MVRKGAGVDLFFETGPSTRLEHRGQHMQSVHFRWAFRHSHPARIRDAVLAQVELREQAQQGRGCCVFRFCVGREGSNSPNPVTDCRASDAGVGIVLFGL